MFARRCNSISDYKKTRFIKEHNDLKELYDKLDALTVKYEAGALCLKPTCPLELLLEQKKYMGQYIRVLKIRAELEKIDLYFELEPVEEVTTVPISEYNRTVERLEKALDEREMTIMLKDQVIKENTITISNQCATISFFF